MKLVFLLLLCTLFCVSEIFLFVILPEKTNKIYIYISSYILSLLVLFLGTIGIYKLGIFWSMETWTKVFLGACCVFVIFSSFIYAHIKK